MMDCMDAHTKAMKGEMQCMGRGLQTGIMAIACDETRTTEHKMAAPRVGVNELGGECEVCRSRNGDG